MPVRKCKWPTCDAIILLPPGRRGADSYCPDHEARGKTVENRERDARRDPHIVAFYRSHAWRQLSRAVLTASPICTTCQRAPSEDAHHLTPIRTPEGWERRLDPDGVRAVCRTCHTRLDRAAEAQ